MHLEHVKPESPTGSRNPFPSQARKIEGVRLQIHDINRGV